jgi:hypothetical protein
MKKYFLEFRKLVWNTGKDTKSIKVLAPSWKIAQVRSDGYLGFRYGCTVVKGREREIEREEIEWETVCETKREKKRKRVWRWQSKGRKNEKKES